MRDRPAKLNSYQVIILVNLFLIKGDCVPSEDEYDEEMSFDETKYDSEDNPDPGEKGYYEGEY